MFETHSYSSAEHPGQSQLERLQVGTSCIVRRKGEPRETRDLTGDYGILILPAVKPRYRGEIRECCPGARQARMKRCVLGRLMRHCGHSMTPGSPPSQDDREQWESSQDIEATVAVTKDGEGRQSGFRLGACSASGV